jgi:hypothetical protein
MGSVRLVNLLDPVGCRIERFFGAFRCRLSAPLLRGRQAHAQLQQQFRQLFILIADLHVLVAGDEHPGRTHPFFGPRSMHASA